MVYNKSKISVILKAMSPRDLRSRFVLNVSFLHLLVFSIILFSCSADEGVNTTTGLQESTENLQTLINQNKVATGNVIACSASSKTVVNGFEVYFYPRQNARDMRYWETKTTTINPNDFSNYQEKTTATKDLFNGYLKAFIDTSDTEKWTVVSFFENDSLHVSNPIRLKHLAQPTIFSDVVSISQDQMPVFDWEAPANVNTAIYFEVVSNSENNLLSGTYTLQTHFQYYNLDNVVLNITRDTPPALVNNADYFFTMMAVSEDNWVNLLLEKPFQQ